MDELSEIALSNFVLAGLRPLLHVRCEAYVKWYMARAFNGAGFECEDGPTDVLFLRDPPTSCDSPQGTRSYGFGLGSFHIGSDWHDRAAVEALLASSEASFEALRASDPERLQSAARLHVWAGYRSSAAMAAQDLRVIADRIAGRTGGTFAAASPIGSPLAESERNGDIDIALPAPLPEPVLRARLGAFFSGLDQPLFGRGAGGPNHEGERSADRSLLFAKFTARQF